MATVLWKKVLPFEIFLFAFSHYSPSRGCGEMLLLCFGQQQHWGECKSLLQNPRVPELKVMDRWQDIVFQDFMVESKMHNSFNFGKSSSSWRGASEACRTRCSGFFWCTFGVILVDLPLPVRFTLFPPFVDVSKWIFDSTGLAVIRSGCAREMEFSSTKRHVNSGLNNEGTHFTLF